MRPVRSQQGIKKYPHLPPNHHHKLFLDDRNLRSETTVTKGAEWDGAGVLSAVR